MSGERAEVQSEAPQTPPESSSGQLSSGHPASGAIQRSFEAQAERHAALAKECKQAAKLLAPLAEPAFWADLPNARLKLEGLAKKLDELRLDDGLRELADKAIEDADQRFEERRSYLAERLSKELREQAAQHGLSMRVVSKEKPPELRLVPFSVVIDRDKGEARFRFARVPLGSCAATAQDILELRRKLLDRLNSPFDPAAFHEWCLRAWRATRAALGGSEDRVRLVDFLPRLSFERALAGKKSRLDQEQSWQSDYGAAHFAWDIQRLRQAGAFVQEGQRLNLGVATGTSATKKAGVLYCEDENGQGEYKLTIFFTAEDSAS